MYISLLSGIISMCTIYILRFITQKYSRYLFICDKLRI